MKYSVDFVPSAARHVAEAREWWLEHRDKAPTAFDDDVLALVEVLTEAPSLVGLRVAQRPGVRRVLLRRIRYFVYFTIAESSVTIIAFCHTSRGQQPF